MRTLVRLLKLLLVCLYLMMRMVCIICSMLGMYACQWGFGIGMAMIGVYMYAVDDQVKEWAKKI
jgi:hypothetical protein